MTFRPLRTLYLIHRWLGIGIGVLVLLWFASGVVMLYVPYPQLSNAERRAALKPLIAGQVQVSAARAWQASGAQGAPESVRLANLTTLTGPRPAYLFFQAGKWYAVWADSAQLRAPVSAAEAARAAQSMRPGAVRASEKIERDQWSLGGLDTHRPLYRVELDDAAGSMLYISSHTGEVVRDTARAERLWNWAGSVIHWIYFTPLRSAREPWRLAVMWTSAAAFGMVLSGMVIGILRLRLRRRYAGGRITPYQGWKRWHHLLGTVVGVAALTWLFSGWLSVNPFALFGAAGITRTDQLTIAGGELGGAELTISAAELLAKQPGAILEVEFLRFAGTGYWRLYRADGAASTLVRAHDGSAVTLSMARLVAAASGLRPGVDVAGSAWLNEGDLYYYRHHDDEPLPVVRVDFSDTAQTSFYLEAASGHLLGYADSNSRTYRWLFNAMHRLDFPWLIRHRPVWDALVIALCLCGAALSVTGLMLGWRRLRA
ncbi:MAG: PepSY domain-containing protein [Sphingomonadaceae bacterium]